MFGLFKKNKNIFGLDVSDTSLKLVELINGRKNNHTIQGYSELVLPKDLVKGSLVNDPKMLADLIRQAVADPDYGKITTTNVVASIPEIKSFVRVIVMPVMSEEEAREAIPWETEAYIPMPVGQVYLDWVILGKIKTPEGEKMRVLISAAPRNFIDEYVKVIKLAGLKPIALELESEAIARSLVPRSQQNQPVLIVDISAVRTNLIIHAEGVLQFTSSVPVAGSAFTETIAKELILDKKEAEKVKREIGLEKTKYKGKVRMALLPLVNSLVEEIRSTIRFYEEHYGEDSKIEKILLTGGSGKLIGLPSFLKEQIIKAEKQSDHPLRSMPGLNVVLGDPWVNVIGKGQTPPLSRINSLSLSTAIGLALRDEQ